MRVSFVVPAFNEELNLPIICREIAKNANKNFYEIIIVDDGSTDKTRLVARQLHEKDHRIKLIVLSKNHGKELATTAGISRATGDYIMLLDADGQHPPALIPKFIDRVRDKDMVIGVRKEYGNVGFTKKFTSKLYYRLMKFIGVNTRANGTDFRIFTSEVGKSFLKLNEHNRMTRSLIDGLGYETDTIEFIAPDRYSGTSVYSFKKLIELSMNNILANTTKPLVISLIFGATISVLAFTLLLFMCINIVIGDPFNLNITGTAYLVAATLCAVGAILLIQGFTAIYIARIYTESLNRPLYIINDRLSIF